MENAMPGLLRYGHTIIAIVIAVLLLICTITFVVRYNKEENPRSKKWNEALAIIMAIGTLAAILLAYYTWHGMI